MTQVNKIDSNVVGLRFAEEVSTKTLPGSPVWTPLDPNSYADFGGSLTLLARNPISNSRQRKKGVITDLDSAGGFNNDITQTNIQELMQGFMFADFRPKGEEAVTAVDIDSGNPDEYEVASTTGFQVGSLVKGSGFTDAANNTMNRVTAIVADTSVEVADGQLVAEASPPSTAKIVVVGFQGVAGDIDVDASGTWPALTSTSLDFTTLGLIVGEPIYIGGDTAIMGFSNSENNGIKRVRSIAANRIELDKSALSMTTEASTTETVQLYFGRVLKNESESSLIKRRSYHLERSLGQPDDSSTDTQHEYIEGAVPSELSINIPTADKVTADFSFVGADHTTNDAATGAKSGTRPALVEADAFNTSSDFSRIKMSQVVSGNAAPAALFAFITDLTVTVNNNVTPNKAVGTLGAFDVSVGTFAVGGSMSAYFADVAAVQAVRNNVDISLDFLIAKDNAGIYFDLPLIGLGDGRPNVEQDQPITLPLTMEAATAAGVDSNLDHTLLMSFFDYLPTAAQ